MADIEIVATKRHRWSKADSWAEPRTCHDCSMVKERFGTASSRYDVFTLNGVVVASTCYPGVRTPPCEPVRHVGQRQPGDSRPDRSHCRFCKLVIERDVDDQKPTMWTAAKIGVAGRAPQCPAAPNPTGGPMPGHEPDGVIIHPPAEA